MSRRFLHFVMLGAISPALAGAQSVRSMEIGLTTGFSGHDFRARYPGEAAQEGTLGVRADLRLVPTAVGVLGVALLVDRYQYSNTVYLCPNGCESEASRSVANQGHPPVGATPVNELWRVDRQGIGVTLFHTLALGVGATVGVLAGTTARTYRGPSPQPDYSSFVADEWFRGVEAGLSYRWRNVSVAATGEYGEVPRSTNALRPYYHTISARVGYALPVVAFR